MMNSIKRAQSEVQLTLPEFYNEDDGAVVFVPSHDSDARFSRSEASSRTT